MDARPPSSLVVVAIPQVPTTAEQLENAIRDGVLVESLTFDAKAGLAPGDKANRALAIDMAAMAVNGGLICVGIAEERGTGGKVLVPTPLPLVGLRERVSEVGLSRIDPPLTVGTRELGCDDAGSGYLLIVVPPSPDAPHMVDNKYRSRGDTTNYVMGDAEVRRVQAQRRQSRTDARVELARAIDRDPTDPNHRYRAHLFVVAVPLVPTDPRMLQRRIGEGWQPWLHAQLFSRPRASLPTFMPASHSVRRPSGWAVTSTAVSELRDVALGKAEKEACELEVDENGAIRLFSGGASEAPLADGTRIVSERAIAALVWRVLFMAEAIAAETSYVGNWQFGVAMTDAFAMMSSRSLGANLARQIVYSDLQYRETTEATYAELTENRYSVLQRLLGRLNRALNDDSIALPDFDAPAM